jgi:chemotaxis protein CheZ
MTRIAHELEAVSQGSEEATQKILAAAEDIDQVADNLTAVLKDEIDRGLAQDIRDRVVQIFEACNFQDLTSQRVAKVMAALKEIEAEIARALAEIAPARAAPPVHGPRFESDNGHASQRDIDPAGA